MPTTTLNPTAIGNYDAFTLSAGASKVIAVTAPDDADTTYLTASALDNRQSFAMDDLPSQAGYVTSHTVNVRLRNNSIGNPEAKSFIRSGGADTESTAIAYTGAYATYSATNLLSLTVAQVNAAECGVRFTVVSGDVCRWTTLSWSVSWVSSGGLLFLLLSLGPIASLALHEMPRFALAIRSRTRTLILPSEYKEAWREFREYRWPRYLFL